MLNLFRMDLRRLFRGKVLYILIGVLTVIVLSIVLMSDGAASLTSLLGASDSSSASAEFMGGSMGIGTIYGLLGLIVMLFICNDYSSGFAKNIFTIHVSKWDYIVSKLMTMMVASGIMFAVFTIETIVFSLVFGIGITVAGPFALFIFIFQKWIVSGAFAAIYIFINLLTRSKAGGSVAAFLVGIGGLVMGLQILLGIIGINGSIITNFTIYGTSNLYGLQFDSLMLLRVIFTSAAWMIFYGLVSKKVLKAKDI